MGPRNAPAVWRSGTTAEQEVQQQLMSWVRNGSWLKVLNSLGRQKKEKFEVLEKASQVHFQRICAKILSLISFFCCSFLSDLPRASVVHSLMIHLTYLCLTRPPRGRGRTRLKDKFIDRCDCDCLLYGLHDWQFDSWQTDTDWSISA